ncbi:MAG: hypothetical protein WC879_15285 [Melioribacteraceae bacterium]
MGKAVLIFVLGSIALFGIINFNMNESVGVASQNSIDKFKETYARNIANGVASMLVSRIADSTTYRATSTQNISSVLGGSANYRVIDTTIAGQTYIKIDVRGIYSGKTKSSIVLAQIPTGGFIPTTVKAAISTNNKVVTSGTLTVDGRDHDLNGNLIAGQGTLGLWSTQDISQDGSSKIGGTFSGTDYAAAKPANSNTVNEDATYSGGYPNTPDSVMGGRAKGFPTGTLKSLAQSSVNGSQYTTNPSFLSFPLKGVTYVELPSGGIWTSSNIDGTGILVIHNSTTNAVIKNENLGIFKGLILADDIVHLHTTVIGAIISITPSPSEGNTIGNGSGTVLFSRQALINGIGEIINAANFGFAKTRITISYWYE